MCLWLTSELAIKPCIILDNTRSWMISFILLAAIGRRHVVSQSSGPTIAHPIVRLPHYMFKSTKLWNVLCTVYSMIISGLRLHYCAVVMLSRFDGWLFLYAFRKKAPRVFNQLGWDVHMVIIPQKIFISAIYILNIFLNICVCKLWSH